LITGQRFRAPRLGPGAVYLRSLDQVFRANADLVRVVEIEPQGLWTKPVEPGALPRGSPAELRELAMLPQHTLTHGIGSPVGGTLCDQHRHIDEFRRWTENLASPWTSEHLSILEIPGCGGPQSCGFLMPPLQTEAQVALAAANIKERAFKIDRPFAFETGVNYFASRPDELADGDFFAAIAEAADCGILLDLNNLWVNARNGRARIEDVLARLPLDRVWEVHLAGAEFAHDHWLDAHCGRIDPDLAMLAADIVPDLPNLGAIIFEISPDRFSDFGPTAFLQEMEKLHRLWAKTRPAPAVTATKKAPPPSIATLSVTPEQWERQIAIRMLPPSCWPPTPQAPVAISDERSFALYAELATSFRYGTIAQLLKNSVRLLLMSLGEMRVRDLLDRYTGIAPPTAFPTDEALGFARFAQTQALPVSGLADVLKFEVASIEAAANGRTVRVTVAADLEALLHDIAAGQIPAPSSGGSQMVIEVGVIPAPFVRLDE
jgi:uncharacterized protein (UPF0276 family)